MEAIKFNRFKKKTLILLHEVIYDETMLTTIRNRKLFQTLLKQRRLMNPELIRILNRPENKNKVFHLKSLKMWNDLYQNPNRLLDI